MHHHGFRFLPLPPQPRHRLLVQFKAPCQPEPYQRVPPALEVEAVSGGKKDLVLQLPDGEVTAANAASLSGKLSQMADTASISAACVVSFSDNAFMIRSSMVPFVMMCEA